MRWPEIAGRVGLARVGSLARRLARDGLDAVTDRRCPGCDGPIGREELVCAACDGAVGRLGSVLCLRCLHEGAPTSDAPPFDRGCPRHGAERLLLAGPSFEPPLDGIVHAFKYGGASHLAPWIASLVPSLPSIGEAIGREALLVPAALHPARRASRGFDQSQLLAETLSGWWGIPVAPILERWRETTPQARLDSIARRTNLAGSFRLRRGSAAMAAGRPLLLVDDVATTGATLLAACEALEEANPAWIGALAAAHGGAAGGRDGG